MKQSAMNAGITDVRAEIDAAVRETGMSLPDLAIALKIKEQTLRSWREGKRSPTLKLWDRFQHGVQSLKS